MTALKHGDEACLHIWYSTWKLSTTSPNLSCELLTYNTKLLTKCSSAIWFLTIWTTSENSDFRHIINIHYIKPLHWSLWMACGGHVFRSCDICKQIYIIAQITRLSSDGGHWIYRPLHFDVRQGVKLCSCPLANILKKYHKKAIFMKNNWIRVPIDKI